MIFLLWGRLGFTMKKGRMFDHFLFFLTGNTDLIRVDRSERPGHLAIQHILLYHGLGDGSLGEHLHTLRGHLATLLSGEHVVFNHQSNLQLIGLTLKQNKIMILVHKESDLVGLVTS